jgi:hypothetical protein
MLKTDQFTKTDRLGTNTGKLRGEKRGRFLQVRLSLKWAAAVGAEGHADATRLRSLLLLKH